MLIKEAYFPRERLGSCVVEVEGWFEELYTAASQWLQLVLVFTTAQSGWWLVSSWQKSGRTEIAVIAEKWTGS